CPLDFSWSNFTSASSACSNQNERGNCCRYINAFVAISIARFANATGRLGVPPAFTEVCLSSISETFDLYGIPADATAFCGLGPKIRVSYQCQGRTTVLEMMQSPNFSDVIETCNVPLSLDNSCKRCLNSGIVYLHHLIAIDDNVTLSVCRDAVFVTLANQGGKFSAVDMATCFFGVQGLTVLPDGSIAAVKRMNKVSKQGEEEFCREIELLARLHHRHLVALKDFCAERNESYGVLLLELVSGRRAIQENRNLVEWSQQFMATDSRLSELVDPAIGDLFDFEQLHMVVGVVQWCTHREGRARPSIKQVLRVFSEHLDPVQNGFSGNEGSDGYGSGGTGKAITHKNEVVLYSGDARCLQSSSSTSRSY
ncbi:hypothetical protein B296_00025366, partial [Ensete ventricosum]